MARVSLDLNQKLVICCVKESQSSVQLSKKKKNQNVSIPRVLVLGGTGRVGGSTAIALSKLSPELQILVAGRNREKGARLVETLGENSEFVEVDIDDEKALEAALNDVDLVVHAAGPFQQTERCPVLEAAISTEIYTSKSLASSPASSTTRSPREESSDHAEFETDSWSDDSEGEKLSRSFCSNNSSKFWDAVSDDSNFDLQESSWLMRDRLGFLYHQYFEMSAPYWRVPLMEKVTEMAQTYPGLKTLRSIDLSPASWMAVAWYPIYHIPTGRNVKDLSASFLTFHTLSSSFQDPLPEDEEDDMSSDCEKGRKSKSVIPLPPFGLATYKMNGDVWIQPEAGDYERIDTLQSAADSWLKQLRVQHHDFNYFVSRSTCYAM